MLAQANTLSWSTSAKSQIPSTNRRLEMEIPDEGKKDGFASPSAAHVANSENIDVCSYN